MLRIWLMIAWSGLLVALLGADWLQFRGTDHSSVAPAETRLPLNWSPSENVAWRVDLPGGGVSGPIVVGDKVVVTASSGFKDDQLHVLCFDRRSGEFLWQRNFWATGRTLHHPTSSVAANTPASDGEAIYAFYSSNDLICLDLEGNLRWLRGLTYDYPTAANDVGMASSPTVIDDTVVVQVQSQGESFAAGIDTRTGETRWRKELDRQASWASPIAARGPNGPYVLIQSPDGLTAHNPTTGELLWQHDAACAGIASAVEIDGVIYLPAEGITALRAEDSRSIEVLWKENRLSPSSASPVVHDGRVYILNRAGVLACGSAETGDMLWQVRLKGPYWATPVLVGSHLYCFNQEGEVHVVSVGEKGEVVGTVELGEAVLGSPAVTDDAMYLRGGQRLWKIGQTSPSP